MSSAKNYCPIALLETLSKLLEKVITSRLIFEVGKYQLIPQSQFGGGDLTSYVDAGICMVHDIKSCWAQNKVASLLTLDVSGYFNNVDHKRLIFTLDRMGFNNNTCGWIESYLNNRSAQFRIDGYTCSPFLLPPTGIPQGSPLSPILSSIYSVPLLHAASDLQSISFAYIDDFTILATSHSLDNNINIITNTVSNINNITSKLRLSFEMPKSELIHFPRPYSTPNSLLPIHLQENNNIITIHHSPCIRWLGFYLDAKLSFKEHVQNMANRAKATIS
ncbi:hypothetical protein OPQ81_000662 [Rhizoctonia solani]|nr:hypothetical protein OPQ81_000662 [Rhizoctonia solani]